jgi:UDP-glucose/GDP-mannose dehydrogenase family, UDP binding domain
VYPRLYLWNDPDATVVSAAREANAAMPAYCVGLAEGAYGDLSGARAVVLGASYRGGVKETAFSGVFPTVEALKAEGATVTVHDPIYSDEELRSLGFEPHTLGSDVDLAVLQSDHAEYRRLSAKDIPGVKVIVGGRRILDDAAFPGSSDLRMLGRFAWPPWRRENGGAAVRDADSALMHVSSYLRMATGTTDRNCRLLLEHASQTLWPCGSSGRLRCCRPSMAGGVMDVLHDRCAGLDIGKKDLKACVRTPSPSGRRSRHQEIRTFATMTNALLELRDWLVEEKVTLVVMEATGDYWRGAYYLMEDP